MRFCGREAAHCVRRFLWYVCGFLVYPPETSFYFVRIRSRHIGAKSLCQIGTRKPTATCMKVTCWPLRRMLVVMSKRWRQVYFGVTFPQISKSSPLQCSKFVFSL